MELVDTHSHLYLEEFDHDRLQTVERAIENGVKKIILPNIDQTTWPNLLKTKDLNPNIFVPAIGIHPCSVKEYFKDQIKWLEKELSNHYCHAIGEIGVDLYWSKELNKQQLLAFRQQLQIAKNANLPVIIHNRESFNEVMEVVNQEQNGSLRGVFHCFSGNLEHAKKIIGSGFYIGIGGIVSYKNSILPSVIEQIGIASLLLETDSPYLPPVPFRGKRNESSYLTTIAEKIAEILQLSSEEVAKWTSKNAYTLLNTIEP